MFHKVVIGSFVSLVLTGVASAEPLTVSYFSGSCDQGNSTCDITASLPAQGFVLTDIIGPASSATLYVSESDQLASTMKAQFVLGSITSYHLSSGIPFTGGKGLRIMYIGNSMPGIQALTFVGYIPGTSAASVPAVSGLGLTVFAVLIVTAGGYLLRKRVSGMDALIG